jgi:transposase
MSSRLFHRPSVVVNKRHVDVREVMNGIMYVLSTGCQWRAIPKDLPPRSTLFDYLDLWM